MGIMAKAKKTTRKSTTSKTRKSSKPKVSSKTKKTTVKKAPKKTIKKGSELLCQYCEKPMKDEKTKMVHERNCKRKKADKVGKIETKEKDLEEVVYKLKDEFEDQKKDLIDRFSDREDRLHEEIRELKEVLRLEIEHRYKDRERIKEEAVSEVPLPEVPSESVQEVAVLAEEVPEPPISTEVRIAAPQPIELAPKAIDQIPMPVPEIPPPKQYVESPQPSVEVVEVGRLAGEGIEDVAEPIKELEEEGSPSIKMDREYIIDIVKAEMEKIAADDVDAAPELEGITSHIEDLSTDVKGLRRELESVSSGLKSRFESLQFEADFKRIDREINKFSEKIAEIMDEIGFGEQLNVSKIPPTILEIVYQATLDDLTIELSRAMGSQDAEKVSRLALEEVRLKTSGSELFKFDGRKIVTDNLAYSIEANLISAKQIQTTYDELLSRLLEHLPHHKAKNFRAMIKVKSQEFAVDRATMLTKHTQRLENVLETSSQMLAALSAQLNSLQLGVREELDDIKNNMILSKADSSEIDLLKINMKEMDEKNANLMKDLGLLRAEIDMGKTLAKKGEKPEKKVEPAKEDIPKGPDEYLSKEAKPDTTKNEAEILAAITKGASSKTAIMREVGLTEKDILDAISELVKDKKVIEKKAGKRFKYLTPDKELADKLKKAKPSKKEEKEPVEGKVATPGEKEEVPTKPEVPGEPEVKEVAKSEPEVRAEPETPIESEMPEEKSEPKKKPVKVPKKKEPKKIEELEEESEKKVEKSKPEGKPDKVPPKKKEAGKPKAKKSEPKKPKVEKKPKKVPKTEEKPEKAPPKKKEKKVEPEIDVKPEKPEKAEEPVKPKEAEPEEPPTESAEEVLEPIEEDITVPTVIKALNELSDDERLVLEMITEEGLTRSGIQSKVGKDTNYTAVLRALRVLIDSGYVGIVTKGRLTLYQKIKVEKIDKPEKEKNNKEVK